MKTDVQEAIVRLRGIGARRTAKAITLGIFVVSMALAQYVSLITYYPAGFFYLDVGWFLGLQEQLQQGRILGRDIFFNYGPLAQIITSAGIFLRRDPSPIVGFSNNMYMFEVLSLLLLAGAVMLLRHVGALVGLFIGIVQVLLVNSVRGQMLVFSTVVLAAALALPRRTRWLGVALAGVLWFAGQMLSTDVGVYSLATAGLFLGLMAVVSFRPRWFGCDAATLLRPRDYLETFVIGLLSFVFCNLALEIYFQVTNPHYHLFDNIRYTLAIAGSYTRTMTVSWRFDSLQTAVLGAVLLYNVVATIVLIRVFSLHDHISSFVALLIAGLVFFRGAITRSDEVHIVRNSAALIFHFLVLLGLLFSAPSLWRKRYRRVCHVLRLVGSIVLVLVLASWPRQNVHLFRNLIDLAIGRISLGATVEQVWNTRADLDALVPRELREALDEDKQVVNFPYANDVAMALGKPFFAPILQSYAAHDEQLQRLYVNRMRTVQSQLEVIYAVDGVSRFAGMIDGVQHVSRVPIIMEYLIEHFQLKYDRVFGDGLYVLTPRGSPIDLLREEVPFTLVRSGDGMTLTADAPTCTFLEMEMRMDYPPIISWVGRPRALIATFAHGGRTVVTTRLIPLEAGRPFTTLVYLGQLHAFSRVFADDQHPDMVGTFDTVTIAPEPADLFTVSPSSVAVERLWCVQIPQVAPTERQPYVLAPGETLNLLEESWVPAGGGGALRQVDGGFFIHSGTYLQMGPYLAPPGVCLRVTASFDPEVANHPEADGAAFVVTLLPQSGTLPVSRTVTLAPDDGSAVMELVVPDGEPFAVRFETLPGGQPLWDWAIWREPRLEPCAHRS